MRNILPRRIVLALAALILASSFTSMALAQDGAAEKSSQPRQGAANSKKTDSTDPVPLLPTSAFYASLKTIDGQDFSLSDLQGKVLVIYLWATWCGPCRYESPELVKMQNEYGDKGFEIVGLDIDPKSDSAEDVQAFVKEFKINHKVAFAEADLARSLMKGGNIPQVLVISRDGHILKRFIGFSPERTPPLMRDSIEQALQ